MASRNGSRTKPKAVEEKPPGVRQRIADLQTALKELHIYGRVERNAVAQMMGQLGKFTALLYLWGKGH